MTGLAAPANLNALVFAVPAKEFRQGRAGRCPIQYGGNSVAMVVIFDLALKLDGGGTYAILDLGDTSHPPCFLPPRT